MCTEGGFPFAFSCYANTFIGATKDDLHGFVFEGMCIKSSALSLCVCVCLCETERERMREKLSVSS